MNYLNKLQTMIVGLVIGSSVMSVDVARADLLWRKGVDMPLTGWVVSQSDQQIVFREIEKPFVQRDGATVTKKLSAGDLTILRTEVELLIQTIDELRLERLQPGQWRDYFEYAEELSAATSDVAARQLAVRLYLIAANGSTGDLQSSCLAGLVHLSNNETERERRLLLQQLIRGDRSAPIFGHNFEVKANKVQLTKVEQASGLKIVRLIRTGQGTAAIEIMEKPETIASSKSLENLMATEQLRRWALQPKLAQDQLHQLVRLELTLLGLGFAGDRNHSASNWGQLAQLPIMSAREIPSFENITPFDPAECLYRGGRWVVANEDTR